MERSPTNLKLPLKSSIAIIGGGASGIAALSKLLENGYKNVSLLEASDRIGGRINTVPFASNVVDLGAQWIHGRKKNVVFQLVKNHGLTDVTPDSFFEGLLVSSEGKEEKDYDTLSELCYKIADEDDSEDVGSIPYGEYFMSRLNQYLKKPAYRGISAKNVRDYVRFFEKDICFDDGADSWYDISTSTSDHYIKLKGATATNWKSNGYNTLFEFLTKKRPDPSKDLQAENYIQFNKEVTNINWSLENDSVKITCKDDSTFEIQFVILTIPLGVLKTSHRTLFTPSLPENNINSIESLQFGTVNKIVMEFDPPFWKSKFSGISLIWTDQGLSKIKGKEYEWIKDISGIYRVSYQPNVLIAWVVGVGAREMEKVSDGKVLEAMTQVFEIFFKPVIRYTKPKRMIRSAWYSNPFSRGSYSSRSPETDRRNGSAFALSQPLMNSKNQPFVLFGGEATSSQFYSTVHGAVESGYREANRLMSLS